MVIGPGRGMGRDVERDWVAFMARVLTVTRIAPEDARSCEINSGVILSPDIDI